MHKLHQLRHAAAPGYPQPIFWALQHHGPCKWRTWDWITSILVCLHHWYLPCEHLPHGPHVNIAWWHSHNGLPVGSLVWSQHWISQWIQSPLFAPHWIFQWKWWGRIWILGPKRCHSAAHLMPTFSQGRSQELLGPSIAHNQKDEEEWLRYYVGM